MQNRSYFSLIALLIIFWGTICPISAGAKGKDERARQSLKKYYDNDEKFQKLSGAAQSALEQLYGAKSTKTRTQTRQVSRTSHKVLNAQAGPETLPANVAVNNPALDTTNQVTQSESCIVLGSTSNNVIVAFNDSGECTDACATEQHFTGFGYSTDGGTVFTDGGALPDDPVGSMGDAGQPVLGRDATNNIIHLVTTGMDFTTGNGSSLKCFRSTDNGATWSTSVDCTPGMAADDFQDKPWLAVDNFAGPGQSNVYIAWRQFAASDADQQGIRFIRSTDGGLTWVDQELIAEEGAHNVQGAFVAVGPDHSVYVFWLDQSAGANAHHHLRGRKSTDQGVTFGADIDISGPFINEDTNGDLALSNGFRSNGYPHAVVVPAGASMNDIEITFADFDPVDGDPDIFRITCDNGNLSSCTARAQVNTDTDDAEQFMPTVAVTPDGGNLLFAWYDMRNDSGLIERFGKIWNGATPTPDFLISDNPFPSVFGLDPVVNSVLASDYLVDYDCAVADNSFFYTSFLDTEQGTPDVVFAKIPSNGPGGILRTGNHVISGGNGNGHIEFNECNDLTIQLRNEGTAIVTSISAVLSTNTPNVTITQNSSSYPDLAPGVAANNNTPFEISTSQAFACGTSINLTLTVTSSDGTNVFNLSLDTSEGYPFTTTTGATIVPGTDDIGNHGDDVVTNVALPFPYQLYDQTFNSVNVSSNGNLQFISSNTQYLNGCLPTNQLDYAIMPHWDDLCTSTNPLDCDGAGLGSNGIFTSVSGSAPNRIFNIEWRATFFSDPNPTPVNFEARFYEGQKQVDFVYGTLPDSASHATVGLQKGLGPTADQYSCNTGGITSGTQVSAQFQTCTDGGGDCGGGPACNYEDSFDDGVLTWTQVRPTVTESGGNLVLTPARKKAVATSDPIFAGCQNCTITSEIQFTGGDFGSKAWLLTHRIDKRNQIEIILKVNQGRVVVKQKAGVVRAKAKGNFTLIPNTVYTVVANYDGIDYEVSINGTPVVTLIPVGTIPSGILGFQSKLQTTSVNRVCQTP